MLANSVATLLQNTLEYGHDYAEVQASATFVLEKGVCKKTKNPKQPPPQRFGLNRAPKTTGKYASFPPFLFEYNFLKNTN